MNTGTAYTSSRGPVHSKAFFFAFCCILHIHPPIASTDVNRFFAFVFKKHVLLKK